MDQPIPRAGVPFVGSGIPLKGVGPEHLREGSVRTEHILDGTITLGDLAAALQAFLLPTGSIIMWGGTAAPAEWFMCDGTAKSRSTESALFAIYGTAFGVGDGTTTFNLPDLRQRFPLGKAASGTGVTLGSTGGTIDHVHALDTASSGALSRLTNATNTLRNRLKAVAGWADTDAATVNVPIATTTGLVTAAQLIGNSGTENPPWQSVNYICKR